MNLLLLIYAMIAGLTGFNAGPASVARMAAVAESGSLAPAVAAPVQVSIAAKALAARVDRIVALPPVCWPDARRTAVAIVTQPIRAMARAAPERRLE